MNQTILKKKKGKIKNNILRKSMIKPFIVESKIKKSINNKCKMKFNKRILMKKLLVFQIK